MSVTDYNARRYEKMKAEQDNYRDWLLHQEPSEILNHTYEYTMREDIVMCMEELELEPEKARASSEMMWNSYGTLFIKINTFIWQCNTTFSLPLFKHTSS